MKNVARQVFHLLRTVGVMAAMTPAGVAQDWWLEAGPMLRGGMKVEVAGPTYVQQLGLLQPTTAPAGAPRDGIGAMNEYADRAYNNGYVNLAPSTGHPEALDPNTTWNWGYHDGAANHYTAANQTLNFKKSYLPTSTRSDDDMLAAGLHLLAGVALCKSENWRVDLALGFQAVWGSATARQGAEQITVNDSYDVSATVADGYDFSAEDMHLGTYNGPFDDPPAPGVVIPNQPASSAQTTGVNRAAFHVDQGLYQFNLGPQFAYAASSCLRLRFRPTVSLNIMDVEVRRSETFDQTTAGGGRVPLHAPWFDQNDKTKVALGLGVTAGADWELGRGYYTGVFGGYEWISDEVRVAVGPNTVSLNGSGFVAGLVLGKKF